MLAQPAGSRRYGTAVFLANSFLTLAEKLLILLCFMPKEQLESGISSQIGKEDAEAGKRTKEEARELKDRMHFIAKVISKNFGLNFILGKNWSAGLSREFQEERLKHPEKSLEEFDERLLIPEVMTAPEKDLLERSEDYNFGVFRHEIGHLKHSDYKSVMESQERAKKEGYKPLDLFVIFDAWEDGRSNAMEAKTSKAARYRLGTYLKEDIKDALLMGLQEKSLPFQYGALCWARGAEPFIKDFDFEEIKGKIKDEKVQEAYEKTEEALKLFFIK